MEHMWLTYIGVAGGAIGTVTGIVGTVISIYSYRRTKDIKSLDLRIEAHRVRDAASLMLNDLKDLKQSAMRSREALLSAAGRHGSGAMVKYKGQWEEDDKVISALETQLGEVGSDYDALSPNQLETKVVDLNRIMGQIEGLKEKYLGDIGSDDNERDQLRADRRNPTAWSIRRP